MPSAISELLEIALGHHQAGRLDSAEQVYRHILEIDPQCADAWHFLGVISYQAGKHPLALECLMQALGLHPDNAAIHSNLGLVYQTIHQLTLATANFRRALELKPNLYTAQSNLGNVLLDQKDYAGAVDCYRRALELKPDFAEAAHNLGSALHKLDQVEEAVTWYRRALQINPTLAETRSTPAENLRFKQQHAEAENNFSVMLQSQGNLDLAILGYRRAVQLKPDFIEALVNLGGALQLQGQLPEAETCCRQAIALQPEGAAAHNNLGGVLRMRGEVDDAMACYEKSLQLQPVQRSAYENLGGMLQIHGRHDEAAACYRRALEQNPGFAAAHSCLLCTLQYRDGVTLSELKEAHAEFERRHAAPLRTAWRPHDNSRDVTRRLRLGFVSPDLWRHPVGDFLAPFLENLDPRQAETVCYSDRQVADDQTRRLRAATAGWRDVADWGDEQLAEQIRADRIDLLFDLAGHTYGNRLLVFARKPAPVQITWLGYAGSTGLAAMDYLLADRWEIPAEAEQLYRERVLRMPDGYVCYDPSAAGPEISELPAHCQGHVTLGCFNNSVKISPRTIEVWARILQRLPDARLALRFRLKADPRLHDRVVAGFASQGIDASRLLISGELSHTEHLADHRRIDLALDPFPFSGGISTCGALWMGVPVVTCPGDTFAGRHSLSHLSNVGLTETIARDLDEYVNLAVALASDLPKLAAIRARLRRQMAGSPLCDAKRFAMNLAHVLRNAWTHWVHGAG